LRDNWHIGVQSISLDHNACDFWKLFCAIFRAILRGSYDFFYGFNEVNAGLDGVDVHENLILREVLKQTIV